MQSHYQTLSADDFRIFPRSLDGKARSRHHPEYAGWHRDLSWNGRGFDRYPEYIVRAESIADVVHSIDFARRHGLPVSVRGSGHSYAGCFLRNTGILLDLSALRDIQIDPDRRSAQVQPGVSSRQLSAALARHGLAFPTGHGGEVGLSGFLLGGGLGINFRAWGGMSTFNVRAIDLVTADGEVLHADAHENPELLWAARGGGPGLFFVVTRFHLDCWPLPGCITSNTYLAKFSDLPRLLARIEQAQPDPSLQVMLAIVPQTDDRAAEECGRQVMLNTIAFADSPTHARALQASLSEHVSAGLIRAVEVDQPSDFESIYRRGDAMLVSRRYRTDNILTDRGEDAVAILAAHLPSQPSPATLPLLIWRGASSWSDAAWSASGRWFFSTYAQWNEVADDEVNRGWLKSLYDELATVASGSYINEFDLEERSGSAHRCYSAESWSRLRRLRRQYDPHGVFHDVSMDVSAGDR
ncbi:FAD-binding oxidoreductase [Lysobacter capsici]|uniref:FAD-binding oxidoreductase n=1 Tax=Lysobacter capsici TaxID=435897 RepID=UPI0012FD8A88|nr:FAD-binding oxidoreductase [Lysobacter capsici]